MMKRELASILIFIFLVAVALGGCSHEAGPESVDVEKIEAEVDAKIASRRERELSSREKGASGSGIVVLVEAIEVSKSLVNEYMQENPLASDGDAFRKQAQIWIKSGQAKLADMMVVHGQSGERSLVKSVHEIIYPGAYVGSENAEKTGDNSEANTNESSGGSDVKVPPTPLDFEIRDVGSRLEVDPVKTDNGEITLNLMPEFSSRLARNSWEVKADNQNAAVETPTFHHVGVHSKVKVKNGGYAFLGTGQLPQEKQTEAFEDSILLMFVRADSF